MDARTISEANRAGWNLIAPRRFGISTDRLRAGEMTLADFERRPAGDVAGRHVVHLACSYGDEVLSWANLGAWATGVDISDVAVAQARRRAAEAGIDADFRRADMLDPPADLVGLDLVHLSWGAICWVPDLPALAAAVAARLRPGGAVLLCDHHPAREVLSVRDEGRLAVVWPVSDVVMAVVRAGPRWGEHARRGGPRRYGRRWMHGGYGGGPPVVLPAAQAAAPRGRRAHDRLARPQ